MNEDTTTPLPGKPRIRLPDGYLVNVLAISLPMLSLGFIVAVFSGRIGEITLTASGILLLLAHLFLIFLTLLRSPRGKRIGWITSALIITGIDYWFLGGIFRM